MMPGVSLNIRPYVRAGDTKGEYALPFKVLRVSLLRNELKTIHVILTQMDATSPSSITQIYRSFFKLSKRVSLCSKLTIVTEIFSKSANVKFTCSKLANVIDIN